jgi:uncharacterized alkaline shock family protein YloU
VERGVHVASASPSGRVGISSEAIAQIVGLVAAESYGIVGMVGKRGLPRLIGRERLSDGIAVRGRDDGLVIDMSVIIEYGLNLAEVAAGVRSRVVYEVERLTGLPVADVEVRVEQVRRS